MSDTHTGHADHATADHGHDAAHAAAPHVNYMAIFYTLCVLTLLSVLADVLLKGGGKVLLAVIVLTIASFKAMFVMLYFMHLKFEGAWKYALLPPTMVLACAIPAALLPDIGLHYYDIDVPQLHVPVQAHGDAHGAGHGDAHSHPAESPADHKPADAAH